MPGNSQYFSDGRLYKIIHFELYSMGSQCMRPSDHVARRQSHHKEPAL
jgi:hypothetical protein